MASFNKTKKNFINHINLYKSLYSDRRTPKISKILLRIALGYFFLPFDIIPDFIPVFGHLDDVLIISGLVYLSLKFVPKNVYQEHYEMMLRKNI